MTNIAIASNPLFELSMVDVERHGPTFSIDTVTDVSRHYPGAELVFIMGEDSWSGVDSWHRIDELRTMCSFAVVRRAGRRAPTQSTSLRWVDIPEIGISSSLCRERIRAGKSVTYWLTDGVREYIDTHQLYSENV